MELLRILLVHFLIAIVMTLGFAVVPLVLSGLEHWRLRRRAAQHRAAEPLAVFMARARRP